MTKCADCRFLHYQLCQRFPKAIIIQDSERHWCGEYKAKAKPKQEELFPKNAKGCRLTEEWTLPVDLGNWALGEGLEVAEVLEIEKEFRDYWIGATGKGSVKADWGATWRNWVRRYKKQKEARIDRGGK